MHVHGRPDPVEAGRLPPDSEEHGKDGDYINYVRGANIGGFVKVADAMLAYGVL